MLNDREIEYQALRNLLKTTDTPRTRLEGYLSMAIKNELTERQRQVVHLYYIEQLTMTVIADEMGVCPSTVSRTLSRAKTKLRRCLRYGGRELLTISDHF